MRASANTLVGIRPVEGLLLDALVATDVSHTHSVVHLADLELTVALEVDHEDSEARFGNSSTEFPMTPPLRTSSTTSTSTRR